MPGRSGQASVMTKSPAGSVEGAMGMGWLRSLSVAELGAPAYDVLLELLAHGVVDRRLLVVLEPLLVDLPGPGGGVLGAVAHPALVVLRGVEERSVEAGAEQLHRVHRAEEVA